MKQWWFHGSIFHHVLQIVKNSITVVHNYGIVNNCGMIVNNALSENSQKWGRKCGTEKSGERYPPISEMSFETIFDC